MSTSAGSDGHHDDYPRKAPAQDRPGASGRRPAEVVAATILLLTVTAAAIAITVIDMVATRTMLRAEREHGITVDIPFGQPATIWSGVLAALLPLVLAALVWTGRGARVWVAAATPVVGCAGCVGMVNNPGFNLAQDDEVWMGVNEYLPAWQLVPVQVSVLVGALCLVAACALLWIPGLRTHRRSWPER